MHLRDGVNGTRTRPKIMCLVQILSPSPRKNKIFPINRIAHDYSHSSLFAVQATQAFYPAPGPKRTHLNTPAASGNEVYPILIQKLFTIHYHERRSNS